MTLRTQLRTSRPDQAGECMIYFIIGATWISTGIKVNPSFWDSTEGIIKRKHPRYLGINPYFQTLKSRAQQCLANYQIGGSAFSSDHFTKFIFQGPEAADNPIFSNLIQDYCDTMPMGWGRVKHYDQFKKDVDAVKHNARLNDINFTFGMKLQQYLKNKAGKVNNDNTVSRKLRMLKAVVHFAQKKGLLKADPLVNVKIKSIHGTKQYLTAAELATLEVLYQGGSLKGSYQKTLQYFLFSCYTALRFSDVIALQLSDIKNGTVCTMQEKTEKPVIIPLIRKARALVVPGIDGKCFRTFTNQETNRFLKQIMIIAGIDKLISFHCARHTFGTLSIYWGIPKEVVAELMGVDFKTVEIYAKIIDDVKSREMLKWEQAG